MNTRILVMEFNGVVMTSLVSGAGSNFLISAPDHFVSPLTDEDLSELRWYLEKYLNAPYAVYEERGTEIRARLKMWGERLLASLFGEGRGAAHTYYFAKSLGAEGIEIELSSTSPEFLGLPWELMREPEGKTPFALQSDGVIRSLRNESQEASAEAVPMERRSETQLRVLMVIARPDEASDVPYQIVARPLLKVLEPALRYVRFEVLRPPTFKALRQKIDKARADGEPYHILHFDGHGAVIAAPPRRDYEAGGSPSNSMRGFLAFEKEYGGIGKQGDLIAAEDFAAAVKSSDIPVVILNACQSGAVHAGGDLGASVATKLLQEGTAAVVAMSYSVYAAAAADFMSELYRALFEGRRLAEAVRLGRLKLYQSNLRPSAKGETPLEDWIVPVYYSQREISFPAIKATTARAADDAPPARLSEEVPTHALTEVAVPGRASEEGVFVGRDDEFAKLERALRTDGVVVIYGLSGVGKTALVRNFARWLVSSHGIANAHHVIFHSFDSADSKVRPEEFIETFAARFTADKASDLHKTTRGRRDALIKYMQEQRVLLILDRLDAVTRPPKEASGEGRLDEAGLTEWRDFLNEVSETKFGSAFVTSRTPEHWLGDNIPRLSLGGLYRWDVNELLSHSDAASPEFQARRTEQSYVDFLRYSLGHPHVIGSVTRLMETTTPASLLNSLRGESALAEEIVNVLNELLSPAEFSKEIVPPAALGLALFERVVSPNSLAQFSQGAAVPMRLQLADASAWAEVFDFCVARGWLSPVKSNFDLFYIHPALPAQLVRLWRELAGDDFDDEYNAAWAVNIGMNAVLAESLRQELKSESHNDALLVMRNLEPLFVRAADKAIERGMYEESSALLSALDLFWSSEGRFRETDHWLEKYGAHLEDYAGRPPDIDTPAGELWLFLMGIHVHNALRAGRLDEAEATSRRMLHELERSPTTMLTATAYHDLGLIEESRGNYEQAELWFRKELDAAVLINDRRNIAMAQQHLGSVYLKRHDLDAAQAYFEQALATKKEIKDPKLLVTTHLSLALLAKERDDLELASRWVAEAHRIGVEAELPHELAVAYHIQAEIARRRADPAVAEELYRQALEIFALLGDAWNLREVTVSLGALALESGDMDSAEGWYRYALSVEAGGRNLHGTANVLSRLGEVLLSKGDLNEAAGCFRSALEIWESLGDLGEVARACNVIATAALHEGDLETAEKYYQRCLDVETGQGNRDGVAIALFNLGNTSRQRDELAQAAEFYLKALDIWEETGNTTSMAAVYEALGYLENVRQRPSEAMTWIVRRLAGAESLPAHVYLDEGKSRGSQRNAFGLLAHLTRLLSMEALERRWSEVVGGSLPDAIRSGVLLAMGEQAYQHGQPGEALDWGLRCASLLLEAGAPDDAIREPLWFIAELSYELGIEELKAGWRRITGNALPEKIEEAVTRFIREKGGEAEAWAWYHRGNTMSGLKRLEDALSCYDKALEMKPDFTPAMEAKGIILEQSGHHEEALAILNRVLEITPESLLALEWRGIALGELGRHEESLASFDAILKIEPDNAGAFYNKACCYSLAGQPASAIDNLRRAVELAPDTYREMAKTDPTLANIRRSEQFISLIYTDEK